MLYDLDTVKETFDRMNGTDIPEARLKAELEKAVWMPEVDRMIAVASSLESLPTTNRYGLFKGMTDRNEYQIAAGRFKYARALTAEEIAKCF